MLNYFHPQPDLDALPKKISNPFKLSPHPLVVKASEKLKNDLETRYKSLHPFFDDHEGKMFGVLLVQDEKDQVAYIAAFSGQINNQWLVDGFVPPVFNINDMALILKEGEKSLEVLTNQIKVLKSNDKRKRLIDEIKQFKNFVSKELSNLKSLHKQNKSDRKLKRLQLKDKDQDVLKELSIKSQLDKKSYKSLKSQRQNQLLHLEEKLKSEFEDKIVELQAKRKLLSQSLHQQVFEQYKIKSLDGSVQEVNELFDSKLAPGGAGDCAAPKLIQYAIKHHLKILGLCEFWWGSSPKKEIRHHGSFYSPCRSKCHSILPFMLNESFNDLHQKSEKLYPDIIYEDDSIIIINKPSGLLSIPGKNVKHSVLNWLKLHFSDCDGALLLHRLDQATSGLLIAAKNADVYKAIQKQFINRQIKKRYVALLSKPIDSLQHRVSLPLRVDLDDRPRQLVCYEHGKEAITLIKRLTTQVDETRVYLYPQTGRTHQLRVHAAHVDGLNNPIVGDELYGIKSERLMLHAQKIEFYHPIKNKMVCFEVDPPF